MSRTRKLIIAFWIFVVIGLIWSFRSCDQKLNQDSIDHPRQEHFWFTNSPSAAPTAPQSQTHRDGADVLQTAFSVENDTPNAGSFTCHVTLKNMGNAKAVGVQVSVRPYRGISLGDEDVGHTRPGELSDNDPIAQLGQWVTFPDLAPGESSTESATFVSRTDVRPGTNPRPKILFQTEKAH